MDGAVEHFDVLIVGAGLSGIGAAVHLQGRCPGRSYAILEANSAPVYLDIEKKTGVPITEHIIRWLERAAS